MIKKFTYLLLFLPFIISCNSSTTDKKEEGNKETQQIEESAKNADKIYDKADKLEQQADSLLNSI